jgi:beta-lactamase class A
MFADIESHYEGTLHIRARELRSGNDWAYKSTELVATASTIKLPILMHAAQCVYDGYLSWETSIKLTEADKVGGMGVMQHFKTPHEFTLHDTCYLMTAISDNTATNLVIDQLGVQNINQYIASLGITDTRLNRKAFSPDTEASRIYGLGQTTASDMFQLLMEIYSPTRLQESVVSDLKWMLSRQTDQVSIPRVLPHGWLYAGKTGRVMDVRGDVGYVKAPDGREWVLSMFSYGLTTENWTIDNEGLLAIAEATKRILGLES